MATHPLPYFTPEQYLTFDRSSTVRHEYMFGDVIPIQAGTAAHARIIANTTRAMGNRLSGACADYSSSLRVCVDAKAAYAYPDLSIVCGTPEYLDSQKDTLTNPKLIVEVLSPSTENYNLGKKARLYWNIASLTGLIFIAQNEVWIEYWFRAPEGKWDRQQIVGLHDALRIDLCSSDIPVAEIYSRVDFPNA